MKKEHPMPIIKSKTRKELADDYGWHRNTLYNRLKQVGITLPKGLICPKDLKLIYQALGVPHSYR